MRHEEETMEDGHPRSQEIVLKIPVRGENLREELSFYEKLAEVFREFERDTEDLEFIISNLKEQIDDLSESPVIIPDEEAIIEAITKHPYFKNPCDYPIRLITILKYLKQKGFNTNYADIDLYIDRLLQNMPSVKKVGRGLYMKKEI